MAWRHHAACVDSASRLCSSSWSVVLFHPLSSRIWSTCLRSLPTTCMSILLPSKSVIHGIHLITNLCRQYTMRNRCRSLPIQVRCTASDLSVTMLICHPTMYIGAYYRKIACNSVSNLVMRVSLVVLMSFPQIVVRRTWAAMWARCW